MNMFLYQGIKLTATKSVAGKTACRQDTPADLRSTRSVIAKILALPVVWLPPRP